MRLLASLLIPVLLILHSICWARDRDDAASYQPDVEEEDSDGEEVRGQRFFRSESTFWRFLGLPADALDLFWYPVKRGLQFSEENQLAERLEESFFFNEERTAGWFPKPSFGGPLGDAGGATVFFGELFDSDHRLDTSFLIAGTREFDINGTYSIPAVENRPFYSRFDVGFLQDREVELFTARGDSGLPMSGMETDEDDESEYQLREFSTGVTVGRKFFGGLQLAAHLRGELSKSTQRLQPNFASFEGFDEEITLLAPGLTLIWDRRDDLRRPTRGWLLRAETEVAASPVETPLDNRYGYSDYGLDVQFFVPLPGPHRALVFRQRLRRVEDWAGYDPPFYHLPVLDLNHGLRAYTRNRFQDRGSIVSNLEYRYPIWRTWDAFLFGDGGQTFAQYSDINVSDFRYAGGVGVRVRTEKDVEFLLQLGFGSEGAELVFSFDRVLQ